MATSLKWPSLVLAVLLATLAWSQQATIKAGSTAPDFSATGTDDKVHTLKTVQKNGPFVLYFVKDGCPLNQRAIPHFNAIATAYRGRAQLVGVVSSDLKTAKLWRKTHESPLLMLADPESKIITAYQAKYSPWVILVNADGKIAKSMEGASKAVLNVVNNFLAKAANMRPANLNFETAPEGRGCSF